MPKVRDPRPFIYAGFDFFMAVAYVVLVTWLSPTRHLAGQVLLWGMVVTVVLMGAATLTRNRWGWRVAAGACGLLLLLELVLLGLILASAAFLAGVYGAFGRGAATMALLAALLTIQGVALLPAFQLKFLMTRAGRKSYGLAPLR